MTRFSESLSEGENSFYLLVRVYVSCHRDTSCYFKVIKVIWRWQTWNSSKEKSGFMHGNFHLAQLVIPWWHLSDKCCLLYPCPKQYREKNLLIQAWAFKCLRDEKKAIFSGISCSKTKYKLPTLKAEIKNILPGSKMRLRAAIFWYRLFFLTVNNKIRLTAIGVLLIVGVPGLSKWSTQRSLVIAYSHVSLTMPR